MLALATLKGASWLIFSRLIGRFIDFVNLLILARLLVPADFGVTALAMALVLIIDTVLEVPVTQALVRLSEIDKKHLDTGFTLAMLRSVAVAVLTIGCAWPYSLINGDPALFPVVCVLAIGTFLKGFYSPAMVYYARTIDFRPTFIAETISKVCGLVAAILVVFTEGGYWALVANYVVAASVTTIMSHVFARYRPAFSFARINDFAGFMGWFTSSQIVSALNWQYDRLMIGAYVPDKALLGRYTVASDVANLPTQSLIGPALQPLMAAFSRMNGDRHRIGHAFLKAIRIAMLICVPACLGIALTADLVTDLLLGPKWAEAAPYLALLSVSMLPVPYYQTLNSLSLALDRPDVLFRINLIDFVIRTVAISIGFYFFSIEGVVYARLAMSVVMGGVYAIVVRRLLGLGLRRQVVNLWKVAVAGTVMVVAVYWLRMQISHVTLPVLAQMVLVASFGAASYGATLLALGLRFRLGGGRFELFDAR
ncbi:lipopolysaccharide biosynthesis protein [Neorhizobium sp. NCHU2750]|uniref:lipopolysaccharide biosynthesis protein n=1 Tax=Neorhizobium sp. NCHU2750 TaxID=1825976 RepID=UPI000E718304|nr:exopolysaccharide biosynthesis protein [Neorhizobium sp. NCHU2750]